MDTIPHQILPDQDHKTRKLPVKIKIIGKGNTQKHASILKAVPKPDIILRQKSAAGF